MSKKDKNNLGMPKNTEIKARIAILEQRLKKSGNQLGKDAGLGNATVDDWNDNQIGNPTIHCKEFLKHYNINAHWWKTMEGEVFNTFVPKPGDNKENKMSDPEVYRTIVEGNTEYVLIPRNVMNEVQLISTKQLESDRNVMDKLLSQNERLIAKLVGSDAQLPGVQESQDKP